MVVVVTLFGVLVTSATVIHCISMFLFTLVRSKWGVAVADADAWCKGALRE